MEKCLKFIRMRSYKMVKYEVVTRDKPFSTQFLVKLLHLHKIMIITFPIPLLKIPNLIDMVVFLVIWPHTSLTHQSEPKNWYSSIFSSFSFIFFTKFRWIFLLVEFLTFTITLPTRQLCIRIAYAVQSQRLHLHNIFFFLKHKQNMLKYIEK